MLLSVSGLSPQVVTETLYALAVAAPPRQRFVPTEIHVLTTSVGARLIREALVGAGSHIERLAAEHALHARFGEVRVHVVTDVDGRELADIRSAEDNRCVADAVTEDIRQFTTDDDCALHVSLAGGRKTMGYYAGQALSLFGREQDRLSHVLVEPPFERRPDFFYPRPATTGAAAATPRIELASIPFVRLRHGVPRALLEGRSSFAAVIDAANATVSPPRLQILFAERRIVADGVAIRLTPMQLALLTALAQRARAGQPALPAPPRDAHDDAWAAAILADLRAAVGLMAVDSAVETSLRRDCSGNKVSPHWSRLRAALRGALAPGRDRLYFDDGGHHHHKRYRVPLPPAAIEIR